ncbi:MAG: DUF6492 family protein [Reyranella sp.]|nr:DUF6492 family protein [Reyranella sp.]
MFSEVRQAILPLALRRIQSRADLERASLLVESLGRHWRDLRPLELLIVAPQRDVDLVRAGIPRVSNVHITIRPESDFFATFSPFYLMPGWFRQQVIKLHIPALLGFRGYLTLDSDIICVGDFDARTFVRDGRALSRWEPRSGQDWWRNVAEVVGVPYDRHGHGLSVTPNILHGDLARQALVHVANGAADATAPLCFWLARKIGTVAWTEYSLYTSVAELKGNLLAYHQHWDACYGGDVHLFSDRSCVWEADDFARMATLPHGRDPGGKFIVVQSHARIPIERVRKYCLQFAG